MHPLRLTHLLLLLLSLLLTSSCCTPQVAVRETVTDTLVARPIPPDSAALRVVFGGHSEGGRTLYERPGNRIRMSYTAHGDTLDVRADQKPDSVLLPARVITREVPVVTYVDKPIRMPLTRGQKMLIYTGGLALGFAAIALLSMLLKLIKPKL
ncbi:MAG: hypothetical protein MR609_00230 [Bacteroidales bacterium]|nr:hypothetical protein [Bacteroidales bacterium]